jgi:hypothetical protein
MKNSGIWLFFMFIIYFTCVVQAMSPVPIGILTNNNAYLNIQTYDGKNQLTHPCVLFSESGWNGYSFLMAMTPYPYYDSSKENPSMRYSKNGIKWEKIPGQPDPVIDSPSVGFLSDPNIELVNNTIYLFYRYADRKISPNIIYYNYTTTTDGLTWTKPVQTTMNFTRSNSFIYNGTGWESWGHSTITGNLTHYTSPDAITWTHTGLMSINTTTFSQWHSEVKKYDNQYFLLMTDNPNKNLRFYTSSDGLTWKFENNNSTILTGRPGKWDEYLYKSSFVKNDNTYKIWYAAFSSTGSSRVGYTRYPNTGDVETVNDRFLSLSGSFFASDKFNITFSINIQKNLSKSSFSQQGKCVV